MQSEDKLLWESFLDGNRESFQAIYTRHYNMLYEYGMRKVDHADQVKDTIQDLFVKLWTNRRNLGTTDNIKYYLLLSLKRRLMDVSVAATARATEPVEAAERFLMEFTVDSEYLRREQHGEQAQKLLAALDQLTPRQREVIYLRYFEELSYEEISSMLDISVKAAYKLSYRALDALKELLKLSKKDLLLLLLAWRGIV